jgi:hypothetical protein
VKIVGTAKKVWSFALTKTLISPGVVTGVVHRIFALLTKVAGTIVPRKLQAKVGTLTKLVPMTSITVPPAISAAEGFVETRLKSAKSLSV